MRLLRNLIATTEMFEFEIKNANISDLSNAYIPDPVYNNTCVQVNYYQLKMSSTNSVHILLKVLLKNTLTNCLECALYFYTTVSSDQAF